jgi:hypothetical protein
MVKGFSRFLQKSHYSQLCLFFGRNSPQWARVSSFTRFLDRIQRRTTVVRTTLDEWSAFRIETSIWQHTTLTTDIHAPGGIRTNNFSRQAAVDLRLRQHGHCDRHYSQILSYFGSIYLNQYLLPAFIERPGLNLTIRSLGFPRNLCLPNFSD